MTNDFLSEAKKALLKGNRLKSIHLLKENIRDNDLIFRLQQLEIRQSNLEGQIAAGTIKQEDVDLERNKISSSILSVINNVEIKSQRKPERKIEVKPEIKSETIAPPLPPTKTKKGFNVKWLVFAVLAIGMLSLAYFGFSGKGGKNTPVDPCAKVNCQNGGKCDNGRCKCPSGYEGRYCETKKAEAARTEGFKMVIEDVFTISGRGTIATGKIISGEIKKGDIVKITVNGKEFKTTCMRIEISKRESDTAKKGDSVGLLLRGVDKGNLTRGMVITK